MIRIRAQRLARLLSLTLALALLSLTPFATFAQTDAGRIVGTVRDPNNAVVPNAAVTVHNNTTGEERTATTNEEGLYQVAALRAATYTVTIMAQNFKTTRAPNVQLNVGQELTLDLGVQPGVSETVEVVDRKSVV